MRIARLLVPLAAAVGVVGVLGLSPFVWWGTRPHEIPDSVESPPGLLTYGEYARVEHGRPYFLERTTPRGALLYFGIGHTNAPEDPQLRDLRARWESFGATIALGEGRLPFFVGSLDRAVRRFGEPALVYALARRAGVPVHSLEPPKEDEARALLERFPPEKVATFFTLRTYVSFRRAEGTEGAERFARRALRRQKRLPGLEASLADLEALASLYAREFPDRPDWREVPDPFFDPGRSDTFFNEMQTVSNRFRDDRMMRLLVHLVRGGERVFAVVGASHVVMQEPALRAALSGD